MSRFNRLEPDQPMPWKRDGTCDLCGQPPGPFGGLVQKVLEQASEDEQGNWRAMRALWICHRHDDAAGESRTPRAETLEGTSRKHPQGEQLFADTPTPHYRADA